MDQFCRYCGAGIGKFRRKGEGTCHKCYFLEPNESSTVGVSGQFNEHGQGDIKENLKEITPELSVPLLWPVIFRQDRTGNT